MTALSLPDWIAVIFGILGILIGIWGIYITRKYKRLIQYSLVIINSIPLFDTIVKNIPDLSILYKGVEISPDLVLIECALVNTGTSAVLSDMIEKPISLFLPEEHKWVAVEKVSISNEMQVEPALVTEQKLEIKSGLFKVGDFIRFKALLLVPRSLFKAIAMGNLDRIISITHRIADMKTIPIINLKKLNVERLIKLDPMKLRRKYIGYILLILLMCLLIFIAYKFELKAHYPQLFQITVTFIGVLLTLGIISFVDFISEYVDYKKVKKFKTFL